MPELSYTGWFVEWERAGETLEEPRFIQLKLTAHLEETVKGEVILIPKTTNKGVVSDRPVFSTRINAIFAAIEDVNRVRSELFPRYKDDFYIPSVREHYLDLIRVQDRLDRILDKERDNLRYENS